jgi:hypothetical protein
LADIFQWKEKNVMDASRLVLVAAAVLALGLVIPVAHAQDDDAALSHSARPPGPPKPWKQVRGFGRVLDLSKPPVVIDEPGLYALQQDWRFPSAVTDAVFPEGLIQITADDVTLDLHGFTISAEANGTLSATLLVITGDSAEIHNGGIEASDIDRAVHSTGIGPWLHHLSIISGVEETTMRFEGNSTTISDSEITGSTILAGESNLERNSFHSRFGAFRLAGDGNRVIDNRIRTGRADAVVEISGNGNVVANNVMEGDAFDTGFSVDGDYNVLRGNTVILVGLLSVARISGTGNTLDGNIAPPDPDGGEARARVGIEFSADGNYYGDNRMAADVPFALGGTVQTDWGGNVGY